jgi:hypothetical protein
MANATRCSFQISQDQNPKGTVCFNFQNIDWYEEQKNYGFWRANDLQMETAQKQFDFPTGINAL